MYLADLREQNRPAEPRQVSEPTFHEMGAVSSGPVLGGFVSHSRKPWVSLPLPSPTQERAAELAGLLRGCGQTRSCRRQSLSSLPFSHSVLFFVCFFSSHPACVGRSLGSGLPWSKCKVGSRRWVLALWCPQSRVVGLLEFHQHATGQTGICLSG